MVCEHHLESHKTEQRCEHSRTDIMDIHHIDAVEKQVHAAEHGVPHGFESLDPRGGQVDEPYVGVCGLRQCRQIWFAPVNRTYVIIGKSGYQLLAVAFHATLYARKSPDAYYSKPFPLHCSLVPADVFAAAYAPLVFKNPFYRYPRAALHVMTFCDNESAVAFAVLYFFKGGLGFVGGHDLLK